MISRRVALTACLIFSKAAVAATSSFVLSGGERVDIVEAAFESAKANIVGCQVTDSDCVIDGRTPMGAAGLMPKTYVKEITVTYQGNKYRLDSSNMFNAWGSRPLEIKGVQRFFGGGCWNAKHCMFRGLFSDAGGAFVAEWQIMNGVSTRTVISDSEDILDLFSRNIDPPRAD